MQNVANVTDPASGRTLKQTNLAQAHALPKGALVEVSSPDSRHDGLRLYVAAHERDCDGELLYGLSPHDPLDPGALPHTMAAAGVDPQVINLLTLSGFSGEGLRLIRLPAANAGAVDLQDWYSQNADSFVKRTAHLPMDALHKDFLDKLPANAKVLDAGCGSGRDTAAFLKAGLDCTPMDPDEVLAAFAEKMTGVPVLRATFEDLERLSAHKEAYDGVWALASLLHVPQSGQTRALQTLAETLKPGGILFATWKAGRGERINGDGRFFCDMMPADACRAAEATGLLDLIEVSLSDDEGGRAQRWVQGFWRRISP